MIERLFEAQRVEGLAHGFRRRVRGDELHVFAHRQDLEDQRVLRHERELVAVDLRAGRSVEGERSSRWCEHAAEQETEGRFARAGLAQHNPLHDPDLIRPQPWLAHRIVTKDYGFAAPGIFEIPQIAGWGDCHRRPRLLLTLWFCEDVPYGNVDKTHSQKNIGRDLLNLSHSEVPALGGYI